MTVPSLSSPPFWVATMLLTIVLAARSDVPHGRIRRVHVRALVRALLPRRILRSRSGQLDIAYFLFSRLFAGGALGWALVSGTGGRRWRRKRRRRYRHGRSRRCPQPF